MYLLNVPLILLNKTFLHITPVSGTTIEASLFNIHTILLDELAKDYYSQIIHKGMATYINPFLIDFENKFLDLINSLDPDLNKMDKNGANVDSKIVKSLFDELACSS